MTVLPKPCFFSRRSSRALCSSTARNTPGGSDLTRGGAESCAPWQRLNFLPLPQGHGSLRPGRLLRDLLTLKIITGTRHQIVAEGQGRFHFVTGARPARDSNATLNSVPYSFLSAARSPVQIGGPQPPAGEQVAPVPLRNGDLRAAGCQSRRQPVTVRPSTDGGSPVYPMSDLRTFVPIPYAALSQGPRHGTWPSGRQAF